MGGSGKSGIEFRPFLTRWGLESEGPPQAGEEGILVPVLRGGRRLFLKVPRPDREPHSRAARVLKHYGGRGAVEVLEIDAGGVSLIERAVPGNTLTTLVLGGDDDAMASFCQVVSLLHGAGPADGDFERIEDRIGGLDAASGDHAGAVPARLVDRARDLAADLVASQGPRRLLHGDLHHDNIVWDDRRGWLAIDPIGVVGEAEIEIAAALRNPGDDPPWLVTAALAERRVPIAVERLGLDRHRVFAWTFVEAVLLALWSVRNAMSPDWSLATAEVVAPLVR